MNIYLYDNTKNNYIQFPIIPNEVSISSPQNVENFETLGQGELKIIGEKGTRELSLESFFPVKDYPFLKSRKLKGMQYVSKIELWRGSKTPLHLLIDSLNINFSCCIDNFEYKVQDGSGDIYYKLNIQEYKVPQLKKIAHTKKINTVKHGKNVVQNILKNSYGIITAKSGVNVRIGNSVKYSKIGFLKYGQKVKLCRLQGKWWSIYFGNHGGHVYAKYIRRV